VKDFSKDLKADWKDLDKKVRGAAGAGGTAACVLATCMRAGHMHACMHSGLYSFASPVPLCCKRRGLARLAGGAS
jgi:hypothetical protein